MAELQRPFAYLLFFLAIWACVLKTSDAQCTAIGCVDCFDWCPTTGTQNCHIGAVRAACRKSCQTCPDEAPACEALNCAQRCILTNDGSSARCACTPGYELDSDGRTCNDIDECTLSSTICHNGTEQRFCKNLPGEYACTECNAMDPDRLWGYYQKPECCLRNLGGSTCGKSTTNGGRVVGGSDSTIARWPWTVYLKIGNNNCGGTLITARHVLTAAHCVWEVASRLGLITVHLGVTNVTDGSAVHVQTRNVSRIHIHPQYNFPLHDIAILELHVPALTTGTFVNTICLSDGEEPQPGELCYASGYGATSYRGNLAGQIQEVSLPIVGAATCERAYANHNNRVNSTYHMCAGYVEGGKDTCQGDSGGPLMCQRCDNCDWYVAGITAFGRECARPGFYGVFTRIRQYETWITGITNQQYVSRNKICTKASWHQWGSWTACSATCGVGERTRVRFCVNGQEGNPGCLGSATEVTNCNAAACSGWSQWSTCSATCGQGQQQRQRLGTNETRVCQIRECSSWGGYGSWSSCTRSCGGGTRRAIRECLNGVGGSGGCQGSNEITEQCNIQCCPHWSDFGPYSACEVTCGGGLQAATRTCECANADGSGCEGVDTDLRICGDATCHGFSSWSAFGPCSVSCNGGQRARTRTCPVSGGCPSDEYGVETVQRESCNTDSCLDRGWSQWENSGSCSHSCGDGRVTQSRRCMGGFPGDIVCPGSATQTIPCNMGDCPTQWGLFGQFSACSVTCGEGTQYRTRECIGGAFGTGNCLGDSREERSCNAGPCQSTPGGTLDCSNLQNIRDSSTCCGYAKQGFCSEYRLFMAVNCAQTCCEYTPERSCTSNGCSDYFPQATCQLLSLACNTHAFVEQGCRSTCNSC